MSKAKYIIPVIMGKPSRDLYVVHGELPRGQRQALAKQVGVRAVKGSDHKHIERLIGKTDANRPEKVIEISLVLDEGDVGVSEVEAALIYGYVNNTLPGAFKAPELSKWYIFERPGDVVSIKLSRFSINLLDADDRLTLLKPIARGKHKIKELEQYR